jgi:hypothetical protein
LALASTVVRVPIWLASNSAPRYKPGLSAWAPSSWPTQTRSPGPEAKFAAPAACPSRSLPAEPEDLGHSRVTQTCTEGSLLSTPHYTAMQGVEGLLACKSRFDLSQPLQTIYVRAANVKRHYAVIPAPKLYQRSLLTTLHYIVEPGGSLPIARQSRFLDGRALR